MVSGCGDESPLEQKGCPVSSLFHPKNGLALSVGFCNKGVQAEKIRNEAKERLAWDKKPLGLINKLLLLIRIDSCWVGCHCRSEPECPSGACFLDVSPGVSPHNLGRA